MPELSSSNYSETDGSNDTAAPDGMPEGMNSSGVNNSWRAGMGALKRTWGRLNGRYASTGSADAYVLTPDVALGAYVTGERYSFRANFTNTGTATLNISALGAKTMQKMTGSGLANLAAGDIQNGQPVTAEYNGTVLILTTPVGASATSGTVTSVATGVGLTGGPITSGGTIDFDINNITGETVPAVDDAVAIYDVTASSHRKMRIDDVFEVINVLTEDLSPDGAADFLVTYDTTAGAVRKVKPDNLSPGVAKAWVKFDTAVSKEAEHNIGTMDDDGAADYGINWTTAFSSADYAVVGMVLTDGTAATRNVMADAQVAGSVDIIVEDEAHTQTDGETNTASIMVVAFGDQ